MLVPYARDGVVSIATLTCGEQEMRRVSFVSTLQYAHDREHAVMQDMSDVTQLEPVVQRVCGGTHADGEISGDAQLGQSLEVTIEPKSRCIVLRCIRFL